MKETQYQLLKRIGDSWPLAVPVSELAQEFEDAKSVLPDLWAQGLVRDCEWEGRCPCVSITSKGFALLREKFDEPIECAQDRADLAAGIEVLCHNDEVAAALEVAGRPCAVRQPTQRAARPADRQTAGAGTSDFDWINDPQVGR